MSECFLYIFETVMAHEDDDHPTFIKIGITSNVTSRLSTVQTSYSRKLECRHSFKFPSRDLAQTIERRVHRLLHRSRQQGEWFDTDPTYAIVAVVDAVVNLKLAGYPGLKLEEIGVKNLLGWALDIDGDYARADRAGDYD